MVGDPIADFFNLIIDESMDLNGDSHTIFKIVVGTNITSQNWFAS